MGLRSRLGLAHHFCGQNSLSVQPACCSPHPTRFLQDAFWCLCALIEDILGASYFDERMFSVQVRASVYGRPGGGSRLGYGQLDKVIDSGAVQPCGQCMAALRSGIPDYRLSRCRLMCWCLATCCRGGFPRSGRTCRSWTWTQPPSQCGHATGRAAGPRLALVAMPHVVS